MNEDSSINVAKSTSISQAETTGFAGSKAALRLVIHDCRTQLNAMLTLLNGCKSETVRRIAYTAALGLATQLVFTQPNSSIYVAIAWGVISLVVLYAYMRQRRFILRSLKRSRVRLEGLTNHLRTSSDDEFRNQLSTALRTGDIYGETLLSEAEDLLTDFDECFQLIDNIKWI